MRWWAPSGASGQTRQGPRQPAGSGGRANGYLLAAARLQPRKLLLKLRRVTADHPPTPTDLTSVTFHTGLGAVGLGIPSTIRPPLPSHYSRPYAHCFTARKAQSRTKSWTASFMEPLPDRHRRSVSGRTCTLTRARWWSRRCHRPTWHPRHTPGGSGSGQSAWTGRPSAPSA